MKQLLRRHEVRYIIHQQARKQYYRRASSKNFTFEPHGGYVELRIHGSFTDSAAADFRDKFMNPPSPVDAGYEASDVVNLLWQSSL